MYSERIPYMEMALRLGRTESAVHAKLTQLMRKAGMSPERKHRETAVEKEARRARTVETPRPPGPTVALDGRVLQRMDGAPRNESTRGLRRWISAGERSLEDMDGYAREDYLGGCQMTAARLRGEAERINAAMEAVCSLDPEGTEPSLIETGPVLENGERAHGKGAVVYKERLAHDISLFAALLSRKAWRLGVCAVGSPCHRAMIEKRDEERYVKLTDE